MNRKWVWVAVGAALLLTGCGTKDEPSASPSAAVLVSGNTQMTYAAAFLAGRSQDELNGIANDLDPVLFYMPQFNAVGDILSDALLNAYYNANADTVQASYDIESEEYRVPVEAVLPYLDAVFAGHTFAPGKVTIGSYNKDENELVFQQFGAGTPDSYVVTECKAVNDDTLEMAVQRTDAQTDVISSAVLRIRVRADGSYSYLSYVTKP